MKKFSHLRVMKQMFVLLFREEPKMMLLTSFYWVWFGAASALDILIASYLYDSLYALSGGGVWCVVVPALVLSGLMSLSGLVTGFISDRFIDLKLPDRIANILSRRFFLHAAGIEYRYFDNDEYYNNLSRAEQIAQGRRVYEYVVRAFRVFAFLLEVASQIVVVAFINPFLFLLAMLSVLPTAIVRMVRGKYYFVLKYYQTPKQNVRQYLWSLLCRKESNRDLQLYGAAPYIIEKWTALSEELKAEENRFTKKSSVLLFVTDTVKISGYFLGVFFSVILLLNHQIELGIFVTCLNVFVSIQQRFEQALMYMAVWTNDTGFVQNYFDFLAFETPEETKEAAGESIEELRLDKVSYQYPEQQRNALEDISLSLDKGEIVALVGENGSGKSTLAKLLLGLYRPAEGEYTVNGKGLSQWSREQFYRRVSTVYQDFMRYELTFRDNIRFGDLERTEGEEALLAAADRARVGQVIRDSGCGLDTLLGREFGGLELSGGQWQRLALARGFYKSDSEFVVVDEPTASIDPIAENDTFQDIAEYMKGRTGLLITHRLGIARIADRIVVLKEGRIVETGTHQELMEKQGFYYELFMLQAKWY